MNIRKVKRDGNDYSLSVPLSILPGLNADFDGDILNIIGMVDKSIAYMFRKFDPIRRMIISRDSGLLNEYFSITKGQLIDLLFFCTLGKMENDEPETFPVLDNDDKTGTITYGEPKVTDFINYGKEDVLSIVYSIENKSEHPLAKAIIDYAKKNDVQQVEIKDYKSGEIDPSEYIEV